MNLETARHALAYSDWANTQVLTAATSLATEQLDQPFDMGSGSLRRALLHTFAGEHVWLQRWRQQSEAPWIDESEPVEVPAIRERFQATWRERDAFLTTLSDGDLARVQTYRDSKGSRFRAALGDMMLQMFNHSTHHRAQIVNMLRRVGAGHVELDYMYHIRTPAEQ